MGKIIGGRKSRWPIPSIYKRGKTIAFYWHAYDLTILYWFLPSWLYNKINNITYVPPPSWPIAKGNLSETT